MARFLPILLLCALAAAPVAGQGMETYNFDIGLLGGMGGAFDLSPDPGLSNSAYQLYASMVTERYSMVGVRAGRIVFDDSVGYGPDYVKANLEYVDLVGEYRYPKGYYDVGIYLGLGGYRVDGELPSGKKQSETAFGLAFGITGEARLYRRLFLVGEINGHYALLDRANLFGSALIGLGLRF